MNKELLGVRDYLKQAWEADQLVKVKMEKLEAMKEGAKKMTPSYAEAHGNSGVQDSMAESVSSYIDYQNALFEEVNRHIKLLDEIRTIIYGVPDPRYRVLLARRYLDYQSWEIIAYAMNYTWQHVHRLHAEALYEAKAAMIKLDKK